MSLRDDIHKALGSIFTTIPDATHVLRHGENEVGPAVQSSSREFDKTVNEESPTIAARYIVNADTFPTISEDSAVELDGSIRVVVACKTDPVGATFSLDLSAEFENIPATYKGKRNHDGRVFPIVLPINTLVLENGSAEIYADSFAPDNTKSYTVAIRREDWRELSDPEPSDTISFASDGITVKVSTVTRHDAWYILKCRTKD